MSAVIEAIESVPGVAKVYRAEELADGRRQQSPIESGIAASYFTGRSGDLFIVPKPYWLMDLAAGKPRSTARPRNSL